MLEVPLTVNEAAVVVASPQRFVKTARYRFPFSPIVAVNVRLVDVAPEILFQSAPPLVLICHCTVGVGVPLAAATKVTLPPAHTVWFDGFVPIAGATFTVNAAGLVVAVLHMLLNTARYWLPLCDADVENDRLRLVAPPMLFQSDPPLVLTSH